MTRAIRPMLHFMLAGLALALIVNVQSVPAGSAQVRTAVSAVTPQNLRVESLTDPIGVDTEHPRFSWTLRASHPQARDLSQSAYQILVASSPSLLASGKADLWNSQKVNSSTYIQIEYAGKPLRSHAAYYWKLRVWDQNGRGSAWSKPATWTTALFHPSDWNARWIAAEPDSSSGTDAQNDAGGMEPSAQPMPIFRHDFQLDKPVRRALVYVSGLGQYELHVNGANVTDTVLNPGWTNYRKTVLYNTYNVTSLLRAGRNSFGVLLGNGMYNVEKVAGRYTKFTGSFGQPKLILQMQVLFMDGTQTRIATDGTWKTSPGPIVFSSTYGGEDYDARREQPGWDTPEFHDSGWSPVHVVSGPGGALSGHIAASIQVAKIFKPVKISEPRPGVLVYDLGQNFAGWPQVTVRGPRGATIKMVAGELLDAKGFVTQNSANAGPNNPNIFAYTLKGMGAETWHPRFSYYGFRYVEVEGATHGGSDKKQPVVLSLEGQFIHDASETDGNFSTSKSLFNRIHRLIDMAIHSNLVSILTDCPHREKLGWLEQTHLMGASIMLNYNVLHLYQKMASDMRDAQLQDGMVPSIAPEYVAFTDRNGNNTSFRDSPEWGSAVVLSPWLAYQYYGDRRLLADSFEEMCRYAAYLQSRSHKRIISYGLGDWNDIGPKPPGVSQLTAKSLTATATYYQDLRTISRVATVLGKQDDAQLYAAQANTVRDAFNAYLFNPDTNVYDRGSQTAQAMPLALDMVPQGHRQAVLDKLVEDIRNHGNHVTAGDIGFHYVVRALSDAGRSDVLYDMMSRTDSPSYGYQLAKGATALTEAWDANPDESQDHFMLGHAEEWFYRGLAGIDFDLSRPGSTQIIIRPTMVDGITSASATYDSVLGTIASAWHRGIHGHILDVSVPPGATATLFLPAKSVASVTESGHPLADASGIRHVAVRGGFVACTVGSGRYEFQLSE